MKKYLEIALPNWLQEKDINGNIDKTVILKQDFTFYQYETRIPVESLSSQVLAYADDLHYSKKEDIGFILGALTHRFKKENKTYLISEIKEKEAINEVFSLDFVFKTDSEVIEKIMLSYATLFFLNQQKSKDFIFSFEQTKTFISELPIYLVSKR